MTYSRSYLGLDPYNVSVVGSRRKLQALACLGWGNGELARWAGIGRGRIDKVLQMGGERRTYIRKDLADTIDLIFEAFIDRTPSRTLASMRRSRYAKRNGWLPVDRWVDIENDEAPISLHNPLSREGRKRQWEYIMEEYHHLVRFGISEDEIAHRLGIQPSTLHSNIQRYRRRDEKQ